jgi:Inositol polyphosphate kinase
VLEDLTWQRRSPCIMDVKIGTRSYDDTASPAKIAYERQKFPLQSVVGFRVQGIKIYDASERVYIEYDKHVGRGIECKTDLVPLFAKYFPITSAREKTKALLVAVPSLLLPLLWSSHVTHCGRLL